MYIGLNPFYMDSKPFLVYNIALFLKYVNKFYKNNLLFFRQLCNVYKESQCCDIYGRCVRTVVVVAYVCGLSDVQGVIGHTFEVCKCLDEDEAL